ncbi:MAG: alpha-hydroxy-acid oxidizing protein [Pyramidobacter sp.]|nr:alpha-hydroxy-acid oxidizing protein [Pyramidobacter sp.]
MNYSEVLSLAREIMAPRCRMCPVCNGRACRGEVPGVGGKGTGESFIRNVEWLAGVKIVLDTIYEDKGQDISCEFFGRRFSMPVFAAPIGGMKMNYGVDIEEGEEARRVLCGAQAAGTAAFTGDGPLDASFLEPLETIRRIGGCGVPTLKPWELSRAKDRIAQALGAGVMALSMDIDAAGLANMKANGCPVCAKGVAELAELVRAAGPVPFIPKGIMSARGALKAAEAGVYGIVVSNHGGRVLDSTQATCEVLPQIRAAVGSSVKIFVDGGIRSGSDVFKALALGADAVLIGRPVVAASLGGGEEGVKMYFEKIAAELTETMVMTGASSLGDISAEMIRLPQ